MGLNLNDKKAVVAEVSAQVANAQTIVVAEYRGIEVAHLTVLRKKARESGVYLRVLKNTLVRRAVAGTQFAGLAEHMVGPLIYSVSADPVAAAKVLNDFAKTNDKLVLKAGCYAGNVLDKSGVQALASIPSREELLAKLLGVPENRSAIAAGRLTAVLLRLRDQSLACMVDGIDASSEYVVKGLGNQLKNVEYIFGATILGDGNPALILNVPDIFARASGIEAVGYRQAMEESARSRIKGKVLVVDDSITTRTIERSILVAHGYRVEIAVSGEDALEKVAGDRFDLVISDVEMPGINGFELTRRLRGLEEYREVPVIVLSSLSRDEDKRKAIDAGAQAYIVKGSFDQGTLLDTVEALIG